MFRQSQKMRCCDRKKNDELIGVLTAISIVSKRLAGKLEALERQQAERRGGRHYEENCRTGRNNG
jgi:hypothetical protein